MALAPRRLLVAVPSRSHISWSMATCSSGFSPLSSGAMTSLDIFHRLQHPFAQIAAAAVPQFQGLVFPGGGAGRHHGLGAQAVVQRQFGQHRGLAPGIQDFLGADLLDMGHASPFGENGCGSGGAVVNAAPPPGRTKAQAPPGRGQDLGLADVGSRRGDYGCCGCCFFVSSFFAGCWRCWLRLRLRPRRCLGLRLRLRLRPRLHLRLRLWLRLRLAAPGAAAGVDLGCGAAGCT